MGKSYYQYYIDRQNKSPLIPCECGCGELIFSITKRGYPARFKKCHGSKGKNHPNWNGGRYKHKGYWYVWKPEHHFADKKGYVLEHRLVYEEYYNICLLPWIEIHHINENRDDNRIENLMPVTRADHRKEHRLDMSDRICILCDSNYTSIRSDNNRPRWFSFENGYICSSCYYKNYDSLRRNE